MPLYSTLTAVGAKDLRQISASKELRKSRVLLCERCPRAVRCSGPDSPLPTANTVRSSECQSIFNTYYVLDNMLGIAQPVVNKTGMNLTITQTKSRCYGHLSAPLSTPNETYSGETESQL